MANVHDATEGSIAQRSGLCRVCPVRGSLNARELEAELRKTFRHMKLVGFCGSGTSRDSFHLLVVKHRTARAKTYRISGRFDADMISLTLGSHAGSFNLEGDIGGSTVVCKSAPTTLIGTVQAKSFAILGKMGDDEISVLVVSVPARATFTARGTVGRREFEVRIRAVTQGGQRSVLDVEASGPRLEPLLVSALLLLLQLGVGQRHSWVSSSS
jgi:hypothetical protein